MTESLLVDAAPTTGRPLDSDVVAALNNLADNIGWKQVDASIGRADPALLRRLADAVERSTFQWTLDSEDDVVIIRDGIDIGYVTACNTSVRLGLIALLPTDRRLP